MTNGEKMIRLGLQEEGLLDQFLATAESLGLSLMDCLRAKMGEQKQVCEEQITRENHFVADVERVQDKALVRWPYLDDATRKEHVALLQQLRQVFPNPASEETIDHMKELHAVGGLYDDFD